MAMVVILNIMSQDSAKDIVSCVDHIFGNHLSSDLPVNLEMSYFIIFSVLIGNQLRNRQLVCLRDEQVSKKMVPYLVDLIALQSPFVVSLDGSAVDEGEVVNIFNTSATALLQINCCTIVLLARTSNSKIELIWRNNTHSTANIRVLVREAAPCKPLVIRRIRSGPINFQNSILAKLSIDGSHYISSRSTNVSYPTIIWERFVQNFLVGIGPELIDIVAIGIDKCIGGWHILHGRGGRLFNNLQLLLPVDVIDHNGVLILICDL